MPEETPLKPNIPIDLREEDLFNTRPKAETIKSFIDHHPSTLDKNRMISLYGEWGSGKTTILKYLCDELSDDIETIFFEAWRHEKDGNLPLSLLDSICEKMKDGTKIKDAFESTYHVMKAFAKSTKFNFGLISIDNKELLDELEKKEFESDISLFKENKKFQENYERIENTILSSGKNKLIIFIDDLDRCEPENVLDLLSAIKLFFNYGEKTIYFCALDKEAVKKAVNVKYDDVIKSDEYLEKIFDISFNMPKTIVNNSLFKSYFTPKYYGSDSFDHLKVVNYISNFFNSIDFTNPRHIKKVLNKYLIVQYIKSEELSGHKLIPEIITANNGKKICIILVLYMIILYEFYPEDFYQFEAYENKLNSYVEQYYKYCKESGLREYNQFSMIQARDHVNAHLRLDNHETIDLDKLIAIIGSDKDRQWLRFNNFLSLFIPYPERPITLPTEELKFKDFLNQFEYEGNRLHLNFAQYLDSQKSEFMDCKLSYTIWNLFKMCRVLL